MKYNFKSVIFSKIGVDSFYNVLSVLLIGICGLILNFIIAIKYDAAVLGVFNLAYAIFVFFAHLSTLGVPTSVLKHVAEFAKDREHCDIVISSALIVTIVLATFVTIVLYCLRQTVADLFKSDALNVGLLFCTPALWCLSINMILLRVLNGLRVMKAYALFRSFRSILMIIALMLAAEYGVAGEKLTLILSIAEGVLLFFLLFYTCRFFSFSLNGCLMTWISRHIAFGAKSFPGAAITDLNNRIDVVILGYFLSSWHVGLYSFASTIVEGVAQIPSVLRQNIDPMITRLIVDHKIKDIPHIVATGRKWIFMGMLVLGTILAILYPVIAKGIVNKSEFMIVWPAFCILMAGTVIQSSYIPFSGILVQSGYPTMQTYFILSVSLTNVLLNFILVPFWGINGASIATALSFVVFVALLKKFTSYVLKIKI